VKHEDDWKEGVRAGLNPFRGTRPDNKDAVGGSRPLKPTNKNPIGEIR
jgi:hypothetical protein